MYLYCVNLGRFVTNIIITSYLRDPNGKVTTSKYPASGYPKPLESDVLLAYHLDTYLMEVIVTSEIVRMLLTFSELMDEVTILHPEREANVNALPSDLHHERDES